MHLENDELPYSGETNFRIDDLKRIAIRELHQRAFETDLRRLATGDQSLQCVVLDCFDQANAIELDALEEALETYEGFLTRAENNKERGEIEDQLKAIQDRIEEIEEDLA